MLNTHTEKDLVINNRELLYKGIFRVEELFSLINRVLEVQGYTKREKKSEETVTPDGRQAYIELRPYKVKTEYVTLMIKLKIILDNVTETFEEVDNLKQKFQQGDVTIIFDSWSLTDYQGRWNMKPWVYFMKGMVNKLIYQFPKESGFRGELMQDTAYLYARIKRLLDSYSPKQKQQVSEEEIRMQVQQDIQKEIQAQQPG
jgi:hypothetical protein